MIGLPPPCVATEGSYLSLTVAGFDTVCAARIFHKLMKRLGFKKFYAQGGDWGSLVTTNMAQLEPRYDLTHTSRVCRSGFLELDPGGNNIFSTLARSQACT